MKSGLGQILSLILTSVLLAFFFWAVATEAENPTIEKPYSLPLTIEVQGLPEGMDWYGLNTNRVRVELRAPQTVWDSLSPETFKTYIDLSEGTTGTITAPVHLEIQAEPVRILNITPPEVILNVEQIDHQEFPIEVKTTGTPSPGYKIEEILIAPQFAQVQGATSFVAQVAKVQAIVPLQGQQTNIRSDYDLIALDEKGNPVSNVSLGPKIATISVLIQQLGYTRDLAVTATLEGQPAPGYRIASLEVTPKVIKVFGLTNVVREAPGFLQTQPINMDGITQSLTTTVALQMPDGLFAMDPPSIYVTASLQIEAIQSGRKLDLKPHIQGLRPSFTATIGIESIVAILDGPLTIMETLAVTQVQATLDLTNLPPGDYNLVPIVDVPESITVQNLLPETVPVKIETVATPTPMPTPTSEEEISPSPTSTPQE